MSNSKKRVTFNDDVKKENYTLLYQPIVTLDQYLNNTSSRLLTDKALKIKKQIIKNVGSQAN